MKRLTQIYTIALDYADEFFGDELNNLIQTKSQKDFNAIIRDVQCLMINDGKLIPDDIVTYMDKLYHMVARAVNDAMYIRQTCVELDSKQ